MLLCRYTPPSILYLLQFQTIESQQHDHNLDLASRDETLIKVKDELRAVTQERNQLEQQKYTSEAVSHCTHPCNHITYIPHSQSHIHAITLHRLISMMIYTHVNPRVLLSCRYIYILMLASFYCYHVVIYKHMLPPV